MDKMRWDNDSYVMLTYLVLGVLSNCVLFVMNRVNVTQIILTDFSWQLLNVSLYCELGMEHSLFILSIFYFFPSLRTKQSKKINKRNKEYSIPRSEWKRFLIRGQRAEKFENL